MAKKFITEILDEIQGDETKVAEYMTNTTLKALFEYSYLAEKAFKLPEGHPPYREAPEPLGMTPTNFLQTIRTWPNFSREDIVPLKREQLFINLLEGVHPTEAELLIAIKDGKLSKLYPFATRKFGEEYGFLTQTLQND